MNTRHGPAELSQAAQHVVGRRDDDEALEAVGTNPLAGLISIAARVERIVADVDAATDESLASDIAAFDAAPQLGGDAGGRVHAGYE